jgi:hypothetical protein
MEMEPGQHVAKDEPQPELEPQVEEKPPESSEVQLPSKEELYTMNDDQLISLCTSLGLDTNGRTKHLRERLIDYMNGGVKPEEEKKEDESVHPCPDCGGELTYVEQYDAWYCAACEKYAPNPEDL